MFSFYFALSVIPAFLLLGYFYWLDKNRKEPGEAILKVFALGIFLLVPDLVIEIIVGYILFGRPIISAGEQAVLKNAILVGVVQAALIEETVKMLFMIILVYQLKEFDERADGVVYTVVLGLGFAAVENFIYVIQGGALIGFLRAVTAVPMHACASTLMGYFIGKSKFTLPYKRPFLIFAGWILAIMFHGVYNTLAFLQNYYSLFILVIVGGGIILSVKLMSMLVAEDKEDLVLMSFLKQQPGP